MSRVIRLLPILTAVGVLAGVPARALAQNEDALRAYFEGRAVTLKIAMPGTSDGVDVPVGRPFDYKAYGDRTKKYGVAIKANQNAIVTLVKLKRDLIEFQLDGGGYGTVGDDTNTSADIPLVDKSNHEKDLERSVKDERDTVRKRELQRQLDDVRNARERENRRIEAERALIREQKTRQLAQRRLEGGSRFNLRFANTVPEELRPQDIEAALAEFVDFAPARRGAPSPAPGQSGEGASGLRRGLLRADLERLLGRPAETTQRREGSLTVTALVFTRGDERIQAELVDDVLIRYTISAR